MIKIFPGIDEEYEKIQKEVLWLHTQWIIYRQIFAHSPKRMDLLNKCAPVAFYIIEEALLDEIKMTLSRLTDPADSGGGNYNLTFRRLHKLIEESDAPELSKQLATLLHGMDSKFADVRKIRNKKLAHLDLKTALAQQEPLTDVSRQDVEECLDWIRKYMNLLEDHYGMPVINYEHVQGMSMGDGHALVALLKDGLDFAELADKSKKGRNQLRSGKWKDA